MRGTEFTKGHMEGFEKKECVCKKCVEDRFISLIVIFRKKEAYIKLEFDVLAWLIIMYELPGIFAI